MFFVLPIHIIQIANNIILLLSHIVIMHGFANCNIYIIALPEPARCPLCRLESITFQKIFLNN